MCTESRFERNTQVLSSVIAAWSDVSSAVLDSVPATGVGFSVGSLQHLKLVVATVNVGYVWMLINCITSAAYVGHCAFSR
jgi:GDP-mannose transporter